MALLGGALIGLAAAIALLANGRIAGISGILGRALDRDDGRGIRASRSSRVCSGPASSSPRRCRTSSARRCRASGRSRSPGSSSASAPRWQRLHERSRRVRHRAASPRSLVAVATFMVTAHDHGRDRRSVRVIARGRSRGVVFALGLAISGHDRSREGHRVPRCRRRLGSDARVRDGRRDRGARTDRAADPAPPRARCSMRGSTGRSDSESSRGSCSAPRCSGSAGACPATARGRRWSASAAPCRVRSCSCSRCARASRSRAWSRSAERVEHDGASRPRITVPDTPQSTRSASPCRAPDHVAVHEERRGLPRPPQRGERGRPISANAHAAAVAQRRRDQRARLAGRDQPQLVRRTRHADVQQVARPVDGRGSSRR